MFIHYSAYKAQDNVAQDSSLYMANKLNITHLIEYFICVCARVCRPLKHTKKLEMRGKA